MRSSVQPAPRWGSAQDSASAYDFRRIHHYHVLPGPPRLLDWNDPSRTGDHTAVSRLVAPLGLCLSQLSRVLSLGPAHFALAGALGVAWGFGLRQSIHSLVIGRRNLAALRKQRDLLETDIRLHGHAPHMDALSHRVRCLQGQTRYGLVLDTIGGVAATLLGVGYLVRQPLLGGAIPHLVHVALPLLHFGAVPPLLIPLACVCVERAGRALYTQQRAQRMSGYLRRVQHPDAPLVNDLYRARQRELAKYFAWDALARGGAVAGAGITVFVGPVGLLVLVPSMLGVVATTCFARRMVRVDDAMTPREKRMLDSDEKYIEAIVQAHRGVITLEGLRKLRRKHYPAGWGTRLRPMLRILRNTRHGKSGHATTSARVLAAYERGEPYIVPAPVPDPQQVLSILDAARIRRQFAKALLKCRMLRRALAGHGVTRVGKKWSVDTDKVAMRVREEQWHGDPAYAAGRMYELAEEVLLTCGKTESWRYQRALLDSYGRLAKENLRLPRRKPG